MADTFMVLIPFSMKLEILIPSAALVKQSLGFTVINKILFTELVAIFCQRNLYDQQLLE